MGKRTTYSIITFFIVSLFLSVLIQSVILTYYVFIQDEYAEQYCENKADLELNCLGSCHLAEQLQFNNIGVSSIVEESMSIVVSIFSFQQISEIPSGFDGLNYKENSFFIQSFIDDFYLSSVFKPPCFL